MSSIPNLNSQQITLDNLARIAQEIDDLVDDLDTDYLDGILLYCEQKNIEIEAIAEYIRKNPALKSNLEKDAEKLNYIKSQKRLPI